MRHSVALLFLLVALLAFASICTTIEITADQSGAPFATAAAAAAAATAPPSVPTPPTEEKTAEEVVNVKADYADYNTLINDEATTDGKPQENKIEIQVNKHHFHKYQFQPQVISNNKIVFLNAQNIAYYQRELKNPILTVWLLTNGPNPEAGKNRTMNYTQKRLFETAWNMNIQLKIMETPKFDLVISQEGLSHILYEGKKVEKLPDAVLPRMGAKVTYFSLAVVRQLEKMGVPVINVHNALEMAKDKLTTLQQLSSSFIPIPKTMIAKFPIEPATISKEFTFPIIMKKSSGSQGKGVMLIQNQEHLSDIADMIDTTKSYLLQEYISKSAGRDIRVIVVGGKTIGAMMRVAKKGFKSNFHQGGYTKPVKLSPAIEWLAINSVQELDLNIAGVDILIDKDTYRICEINSTPGFQGFELATGIDVAAQILEYVKFRCGIAKKKTHREAKSINMIPVMAEHVVPEPKAN